MNLLALKTCHFLFSNLSPYLMYFICKYIENIAPLSVVLLRVAILWSLTPTQNEVLVYGV